jgi:hypothetical protein
MKQLTFIICALLVLSTSRAQDAAKIPPIDITDYTKWPAGVKSQTYKLSPQQSLTITIENMVPGDTSAFFNQSFIIGKYRDTAIAKTTLAAYFKFTNLLAYDPAKKQLTITTSNKYAGLNKQDSVVLTLIKSAKDSIISLVMLPSPPPPPPAPDQKPGAAATVAPLAINPACLDDYFNKNFGNDKTYLRTDVGYKTKADRYGIHVFLDPTGNFLYGSKPTGIQRVYHYVIHIIYNKTDPNLFRFAIGTNGDLSDQVSVYNIGNVPQPKPQGLAQPDNNPPPPNCDNILGEEVFNTFPTSDDLTLTLSYIPVSSDNKLQTAVQIQTYTIKKTAYYFASFNGGLVNTWLGNPSFSLVAQPSATTTTNQTVKVTDNGSSVNFVLMTTIYFSLVNLIDPYEGGNSGNQRFSYWGRSYLDDGGNLFRKIYPAIGVGLNGNVLTNFYAGFNFEPLQGFGIFIGQNIRKVATFDMPDFSPGVTTVTQSQFDYYQNTKWKSGWVIGAILDFSIFNKLFGGVSSPAPSTPTTPSGGK